jgi:uncharacterized protein (TIGR00251 family)
VTAAAEPWRIGGRGLLVRVRLTPKAARDAVEGVEATAEGPAIKARVRAVPEDGAANAALERLVAEWLGVSRSSVELVSGGKSRVKTLGVTGDGAALAAQIEALLAALSPPSRS